MSIYNTDGNIKLTSVDGNTLTGLYASDGSINVVIGDGSAVGAYHACGAFNAVITTDINLSSNVNGNVYIIDEGSSVYVITTP